MKETLDIIINPIANVGKACSFLTHVIGNIFRMKIRVSEVIKQVYEQGYQSILIVILASLASGVVLALQGYVVLVRFGAKEFIAPLVALSLVRELSPVFTALIFSGKAGARIAAELGTMKVNDQILATRTLGVDPIEFLVVPRAIACMIVLPFLTVISEIAGIVGGYIVGVFEAKISGVFYINQTIKSIEFIDFFSGYFKVFFFALLIGWVCCYQGYSPKE